MTPEELDCYLRAPSEHERRYIKGWENPEILSRMDSLIIKGETLRIFRLQEQFHSLSCGKHSRFISYPPHRHLWVELNYMYSGSCIQNINGKEVELKQGQTILLDKDTVHKLPVLGEDDILLNIYIGKEYLATEFFNRISPRNLISEFLINSISDGLDHDNYMIFTSETRRRLPILINEFFCEYYAPSECVTDILSSLFTLIITELIEVCRTNAALRSVQPRENSVLPILKYIEKNYQTASLTEAAAFFNMHPDYLSKRLKAKTGNSFQTLLTRQRMITARQLLTNSAMPVSEIAQYIGYNNITFFYRKFKEAFHCLPGEYREKSM